LAVVWKNGLAGVGINYVPKKIGVIVSVQCARQTDLLQVVQALRSLGLFFRFAQGRQEHRGQNRNNRNDDEQFNQGEGVLSAASLEGCFRGSRLTAPSGWKG
jgi:hypothetical protein